MRNRITGTKSQCKLYDRLDEIPMPAYERLAAKAHLARAEAIADLIATAIRKVRSLAHAARELVTWPKRWA